MKNVLMKCLMALWVAAGLVSCASGAKEDATEKKIDDLLRQMTLEEKIGQMNQLQGVGYNEDMVSQIREGGVGSILNDLNPDTINMLQRVAVEETRLGIPLVFARDVIHGFKTIFPIPLGQAAGWNVDLVEQGARIAAYEATSVGIRWTFAPMIDVSRDPRWGRIAESCGEDTYLNAVMGAAMIRGFQGESLSDPRSMAACAKHFAAYGASESGKDYNTTNIPERLLRDVYLPPFKAAVDAGAATFMCSFNDIDGVPSSGNKWLNIDVLRQEWGYDGMLVSDWGSIEQMIPHHFCSDLKDAAHKAAIAGVDMDMMGFAYITHLKSLVEEGVVKESVIDEAVRNILRLKFRLGLFDNPYVAVVDTLPFYQPASLEVAQRVAAESAILLKNNNVLPLKSFNRVAVVGPLADAPKDQVGTWCFDAEPEHCVTPMQAIKERYGNKVVAVPGLTYSRDTNKQGIAQAVAAARSADVVLFFAGEESLLTGEAHCRADLTLPGAQTEMLKALKATGKPVVMIVMTGRPMVITEEVELADAVIYSFHAGTMAGPGLADVIFGDVVPSGKLPATLPLMTGQVPVYYAHKNTGRPAADMILIDDIPVGAAQSSLGFTSFHLDAGDSPLFPFGYGLSYTTFDYSPVTLSAAEMTVDGTIEATCTITNTGKYDADEVIQFYIGDKVASVARPVKELKGFKKLHIESGESVTVAFDITAEQLAFTRLDMTRGTEPGEFDVWIASDSRGGEPVTFVLK
ncbi:MAG: glycoside hydrolase family 3 C-terminal domain-containing protein [Bacteroidaceae bacterium]|nr:glycoside hydrolase family 3 C-terminal domain-containing protein [Bacteroidaceae bacterium]